MSWQMMRLMVELSLSLHFFVRLRMAFGGGWWQLPLIFWMGLMFLPMLFMRRGLIPESAMEILMWLWPIWIGFLILFTLSALGLDLLRLVTGLSGALAGKSWWSLLAAKKAVPAALAISLLLAIHSYYEAFHPETVKVEILSKRLPDDLDALRVVQLTDVHLSRFIGPDQLERMVEMVRAAKPDILVMTGDLVDADMSQRLREAELLASIRPRLGAYGVLGNHEMYAGQINSVNFYKKSGLHLLRGEAVEAGGIVIAGIDDEAFGSRGNALPPEKLLAQYRNDPRFVLLLKHRPVPAPNTDGLFDLQLSGHTHGGQIFPGHLIIKRANGGFLHGLYDLSSRSAVYVSRGAGFWGLPYRFLAQPEITVIDIKKKTG